MDLMESTSTTPPVGPDESYELDLDGESLPQFPSPDIGTFLGLDLGQDLLLHSIWESENKTALERLQSDATFTKDTDVHSANVLRNLSNYSQEVLPRYASLQDIREKGLEYCANGGIHAGVYFPRKRNRDDDLIIDPVLVICTLNTKKCKISEPPLSEVITDENKESSTKDILKFGGRKFEVGDDNTKSPIVYTHGTHKELKFKKYMYSKGETKAKEIPRSGTPKRNNKQEKKAQTTQKPVNNLPTATSSKEQQIFDICHNMLKSKLDMTIGMRLINQLTSENAQTLDIDMQMVKSTVV